MFPILQPPPLTLVSAISTYLTIMHAMNLHSAACSHHYRKLLFSIDRVWSPLHFLSLSRKLHCTHESTVVSCREDYLSVVHDVATHGAITWATCPGWRYLELTFPAFIVSLFSFLLTRACAVPNMGTYPRGASPRASSGAFTTPCV